MRILPLLFFLAGFNVVFGQVELIGFHGSTQREKVNLTWEIAKGSSCNGTTIQRSADGINFYDIGEIQGICGSPDADQTFNFADESPIPFSRNYYRLLFGSSGYSTMIYVEFAFVLDYIALENPFSSTSQLYLSTDGQITIKIYDAAGKYYGLIDGHNTSYTIGEIFPNLLNGIIIIEVSNDKGNYLRKKFLKLD